MRLEICGGIGAGKSTLCMLLVNKGFNVVPENFNANPFWEAFYLNPGQYIFETEVTFTLQHYHELKKIEKKNMMNVCDFSFSQDLAYAKIGLNGNKLNIFKNIYNEIIDECGLAEGIICLKCDVDVLIERIERRGRDVEKKIDREFLLELTNAIYSEVEKLKNQTKIMYIDSAKNDYLNDELTQNRILDCILKKFGISSK